MRPAVMSAVPLLLLLVAVCIRAADPGQLVTNLPGQPPVSFRQYAGYITVNPSHGRALFYWFYESLHPLPSSLPLVLWLNGGPGCSSVGNGALSELGPFSTNNNGNGLILNKYSWTKAANIIFLESPYGTGFSYSNTSSDYNHFSDEPIAEDAYAFLVGWLKKFPEYQTNEFLITGESYAGHYIPTLAQVILHQNKLSDGFHINFKGFAIGNPWSDAFSDNSGTTDFYFSHSLISDETYELILANCDFAFDLPVDSNSANKTCNKAVANASVDMANIDIYNVYGLSCNQNSSFLSKKAMFTAHVNPCLDSVTPYLNNPAVQAALHVTRPMTWSDCSNTVFSTYSNASFLQSMVPVYHELLKEGLKIWIYSGDVDGVVSTLGTRKWIKKLRLPIEVPWYAWDHKNQVGGWTQQYKGLTFATVRGAGHLVPATQPARALALFRSFLAGKPLPKF